MKVSRFTSLLFLLLPVLIFLSSCKEEGCTDPNASNYNPDATKDNGNCQYNNTATLYTDNGDGTTIILDRGEGTGTMVWTNDTEWILDGFIFVNKGSILTIEAGTVIRGKSGSGTSASALIVARGARILAEGTQANPIIMTAEADDLSSPADIPSFTTGLWGGLIILGDAKLNSTPGETSIEGLPTTEPRGLYGGSNDADDSGVLKYISIRYGGTDIGAGNEINGCTFGGVGSGTVVDHIEVIYNQDDGFEFFGGTVGTKNLIAAFCGDDCFDYDEGFRGKCQFWFALQGENDGDRGGEHDGGTDPETGNPYAHPVIYNATYIGRGITAGKRAVTFRDNAGGEYHNSLFVDYAKGIDIELLSSGEHSYSRFTNNELVLQDNVFHNVANNIATELFTISVGSSVSSADSANASTAFSAYFATAGNFIEDPAIVIARAPTGQLNMNPTNVNVNSGAVPASGWFSGATYFGAFDASNNWLAGWTFLDAEGYF